MGSYCLTSFIIITVLHMCLDLLLTIFQDVRKRITLSKVTHSTVAEKEKKNGHTYLHCVAMIVTRYKDDLISNVGQGANDDQLVA